MQQQSRSNAFLSLLDPRAAQLPPLQRAVVEAARALPLFQGMVDKRTPTLGPLDTEFAEFLKSIKRDVEDRISSWRARCGGGPLLPIMEHTMPPGLNVSIITSGEMNEEASNFLNVCVTDSAGKLDWKRQLWPSQWRISVLSVGIKVLHL